MLNNTDKELKCVRSEHLRAGITPALFEMDALRLDEMRISAQARGCKKTEVPAIFGLVRKLLAGRFGADTPIKSIAQPLAEVVTPAE